MRRQTEERGNAAQKLTKIGKSTYLLEFIFAENGLEEMCSSMGLFTDGIGMLDMPLS